MKAFFFGGMNDGVLEIMDVANVAVVRNGQHYDRYTIKNGCATYRCRQSKQTLTERVIKMAEWPYDAVIRLCGGPMDGHIHTQCPPFTTEYVGGSVKQGHHHYKLTYSLQERYFEYTFKETRHQWHLIHVTTEGVKHETMFLAEPPCPAYYVDPGKRVAVISHVSECNVLHVMAAALAQNQGS